jgi:hypothetical protein
MSIVVKYKLVGSLAFKEYSIQYSELPVSFSTDGLSNDDFMINNSVDNSRRFLSMYKIIGNFIVHVRQILKNDTEYFKSSDITHIEVVDNRDDNLLLFDVFKTTDPLNNNQTQNLICLDFCKNNRNTGSEGDLQNSYFNDNFADMLSNLQSFVCNYPCLFSPYYSWCFHGSATLTHVSLNLQKEANGSPVTIPNATFYDSKIVAFESTEVTQVNQDAFWTCSKLKRVFLPKCTEIHNGGFRSCSALEYLSIPSITKIYNEQDVNYAVNYANNSLDEMTIGQTSLLKFLVLPSKNILLEDESTTKNFTYSEVELLKICVTKNNGTIKFVDDIANYILLNMSRDVCHISILDIDCDTEDIVAVIEVTQGSSIMPATCFQNIRFDIDSDGKPYNFVISVPDTPIPSLPMLKTNTTIADDFISDTLDQLGLSVSSANATSIANYKANLLADINTKIKNLLTEEQYKIGETLFKFANNSDRVVLITDEGNITGGTLNMLLDDKIKFIIRLISGNGIAYDKSYEIVYSLQ